jgi:formylglycine-generating enzyme required for sulfatase activity
MWLAVMGRRTTWLVDDPQRPQDYISWEDAQDFLKQLAGMIKDLEPRFPTEAEWEYACRAGTTTAFYSGPVEYIGLNNVPALDPIAWYKGNSGVDEKDPFGTGWQPPEMQHPAKSFGSHLVKMKQPNAWGLYDMIGNVDQWCSDWLADYPPCPATDPTGPVSGNERILRGGSFFSDSFNCRCASRGGVEPGTHRWEVGIRICVTALHYQPGIPDAPFKAPVAPAP